MNNIIEMVEKDKNLDILYKSVKASGLSSELQQNGPFTIFAPTDMAFNKMDSEKLTSLLKPENKVQLSDFVKNHVIPGKTSLQELKDGEKLKTLGGRDLKFRGRMEL